MLDNLLDVQTAHRWITSASMDQIAATTGPTRIAVEGVASFYFFLSQTPSPLDRVRAQVDKNIRLAGEVLMGPVPQDAGLQAALTLTPASILDAVEHGCLRGCGGTSFLTVRKWRMAAAVPFDRRFIICNAD